MPLGGTTATDRNLYLTGAIIDRLPLARATLAEYSQGFQSISFLVAGANGS